MNSLEVEVRSETGKGVARKLRAAGKVPGVIYGPETEPVPVVVDPTALVNLFAKANNRNLLVDVQVDGNTVPCLVREVQRHPLSRAMLHVDFFRVAADRKVQVDVPLVPVGKPKGATLGGRLRLIRRTLTVRCLPKDIPAAFEIDATPLNIGDMVSSSDIALPEGVELTLKQHVVVLSCYGKSKAALALEAIEAAEAEGEEPAAEGGDAEGAEA